MFSPNTACFMRAGITLTGSTVFSAHSRCPLHPCWMNGLINSQRCAGRALVKEQNANASEHNFTKQVGHQHLFSNTELAQCLDHEGLSVHSRLSKYSLHSGKIINPVISWVTKITDFWWILQHKIYVYIGVYLCDRVGVQSLGKGHPLVF